LDCLFIAGFSFFAFTSFFFDSQTAFGVDMFAEDANVFVRMNLWFAQNADPLLLRPPLWLQIMCAVSAFVYGPFYLFVVVGFVKGSDAVRTPAMIYAGAMELSMLIVLGVEYLGDINPTNNMMFLGAYLPYAVLPAALAYRLRRPFPFTG